MERPVPPEAMERVEEETTDPTELVVRRALVRPVIAREVVVACEVVALSAVKFCSVVEEVTERPVLGSQMSWLPPAVPKRTVEEAEKLLVTKSDEVVAAVIDPKCVWKVKSFAAPAAVASVPQMISPAALVSRASVQEGIVLNVIPALVRSPATLRPAAKVDVAPALTVSAPEVAILKAATEDVANVLSDEVAK